MGQSVVVIGAGIAGLATAGLLARAGYDVTVVERTTRPGGRADSLTVEGFRFDTGPSWYLMPEAFDQFFALMGTSTAAELDLVDLDPGYRIYSQGYEPIDIPRGAAHVAALAESLEPGAGAALEAYLEEAGALYHLALNQLLYTTFSSVRALVTRPLLGQLGRFLPKLLTRSLHEEAARYVSDRRLQQMLTYPAVLVASQPYDTPAMYQLMSHTDLTLGVQYPQGGFHAVVTALYRLAVAAGAQFLFEHSATAIHTTAARGGRARVTGVQCTTPTGTRRLPAEIVVSGADLHHTETALLPPALRSYPEQWWSRRNPGPGAVLVLLGVEGALPELAHHTLVFSADWAPDFQAVFAGPHPQRPLGASQSIYVSKPSATDPTVAPEGMENLFVLIPTTADPSIGHGDAFGAEASPRVTQIADAAIAHLSATLGVPDLAQRIRVRRTIGPADHATLYHSWRGSALGLAHTLRQSAFLRGKNMSDTVSGLYYAGATTVPGVGVPMCLISAENVLKRLRGDHTAQPTPAPLEPTTGGLLG